MFDINWWLPPNIKAIKTQRNLSGYSLGNYGKFNIAMHVGDNITHVMQNRAILREFLPSEPLWLNQEHTNNIANLIDYPDTINQINNNPFDGVITSIKNQVLYQFHQITKHIIWYNLP